MACISAIVPYYLTPIHTNAFIQTAGSDFGQIEPNVEACNVFFKDSVPRIEVYFDNNNDGFIRITDIFVNVIEYEYILEKDIIYRTDIGGMGDIKEPIYLKTEIEPYIGSAKTEMNWELNIKYRSDVIAKSDNYIEIAESTSEKFFIKMDTDKQGYYGVEIEFHYMYHGVKHKAKTEVYNYIFIDKNMKDSQLRY